MVSGHTGGVLTSLEPTTVRKPSRLPLALLALALVAASFAPAVAQKKGKTRPLTTKQMMAGLVKPQLVALQKAAKAGPESDEDWAAIATAAALLNESGHLMMADDRCPDAIWKQGCEELKSATKTILEDVRKKDADLLAEHASLVTKSCKTCHTEHKYKKKD